MTDRQHCHRCEQEVTEAGPWCDIYAHAEWARCVFDADDAQDLYACDGYHHPLHLVQQSRDGEYSCLGCGVVLV
jgi:hypothetical protein